MLTALDFAGAIDNLTGQVAFSLPLMSVPGPPSASPSIGLSYASAVADTVGRWNLTDPTGVAGLGWSLSRWAIAATGAYGADPGDCSLVLILGGTATALIPTDDTIAGDQQWHAVAQPFWQIRFDSDSGVWTVVDENGTNYRFGRSGGSGPGATEYAVTAGDWIASTGRAAPQSQTPIAWNLASITDLFGNQCRFFYDIVTSTLSPGGLAYSQACYLTKVAGAWGDTIELAYVEKESFEYAPAYTAADPPPAYQFPLETRALASVTMIPADLGTALLTATLAYDTGFNGVDPTDTAFNKRTLTGITLSYPDGSAQPPLRFAYVARGTINAGALATVTALEGAVVTYGYGVVADLEYSARAVTLTPPVATGVTFGILRFLFEDGFTVALWSGSDRSLVIAPYRWEGRWLAGTATRIAGAAPGAILAESATNLFGVIAAGTLYGFYRDPRTPDGWIAGTVTLATSAPAGTTGYQLAAGDRFLALLCQPSGSVFRVDFASLAWSVPVAVTTMPTGQGAYALAAQGNKLLVAGAAANLVTVWVGTRGGADIWTSGETAASATLGSGLGLTAAFCEAGAAVLATGSLGGQPRYIAFATAFDPAGAPGVLTAIAGGGSATKFEATGMTVRVDALVARYDGESWVPADLGSFDMPAGASLASVSVGQDIAARSLTLSGGASEYQLIGYDANQGLWKVQATAGAPASGVGVAVAPRTPFGPSRYAVLADSLYYMESDLSWAAVANATLPAIAAADATSVQLLGDMHLLFQNSSADSITATFLANGGALASVAATPASIQVAGKAADFLVGATAFVTYQGEWNAAGMVLTLRAPVALAIEGQQSAIVVTSVAVTSGYAGQAATVTIPGAAAQGTVELLGDARTTYDFLASGATITPDGATGLFNCAESLPMAPAGTDASAGKARAYLFNGLVTGETPVAAPPDDEAFENAAAMPGIVAGLTYGALAVDNAGATVSQQDSYWWSVVTPWPSGFTAYSRTRRSVTTLDGVATTLDAAYRADTGFPATLTDSYVDGAGATVTTTRTMTYFPDEYGTAESPHVLSAVISTYVSATTTPAGGGSPGTAVPVAGAAVTWQQDWGSGVTGWAPLASYRQTEEGAAPFGAWTSGATLTPGWQAFGAVGERSRSGIVTAGTSATGVESTSTVDRFDRFAYAQVFNADPSQFSYFGCEPYETGGGWSVVSGGSLTPYLTTADAHTGTTSLTLPPGTSSGKFVNYLQPSDADPQPGATTQTYVFGCWARSPVGFTGSGTATATFTALWTEAGAARSAALTSLTLSSPAASPWTYFQTLLDFQAALGGATPDPGSFTCQILLANTNAAASLLLDELRFSPQMCGFGASVIDTKQWLPRAAIDTNGQSVATVYDGWFQPVAAIGPGDSILGASFSGLSRQFSGTADAFSPSWPNSTVTLTPGGATQYDDFTADMSANWTFSGAWTIAGGLLGYAGASTGTEVLGGTARPVSSNTANFGARVIVSAPAGSSPAIGDGTIFLRWDATANSGAGQFALVALDGVTLTTLQVPDTNVPFGDDWLFIAIDGFYYCAIGGIFLFAYLRDAGAPAGAGLMLASNGPASFDDLIRLDDPGVSIASFDAMARPVQQLGLIGGSPSGTGNRIAMQVANQFYDSFGRQVVTGLPRTGTLALSTAAGALPASSAAGTAPTDTGQVQTLPDGSPTQYLLASSSGSAALEAYVQTGVAVSGMAGDQLLYSATISEPSPLGRPQSALPTRSADDGNATGYQRSWAYLGRANLWPAAPATANPVYRQAKAAADIGTHGATAVTMAGGDIRAQDGRLLQRFQGPAAAPASLIQSFTYTPAGRLASRAQANAAAPPAGTDAATWTETFEYDFLGRLIEQNSPDSGVTEYAYDRADALRFYMDSDGAAASPQRIAYMRYDRIGRPVEQGWINDAAYAWGSAALAAKLDDQSFPNVTGGTGSGAIVAGRWRRQFRYDGDGTATTLNLLGRLWQMTSQPDSGTADTSTSFAYDAHGRTVSTSETVASAAAAATGYGYTPAGRLASITYPALDAGGFGVGYYYDRLGRLAGIGEMPVTDAVIDPSQPTPAIEVRYAAYRYGSAGQVSAVGFNQAMNAQVPAFTRQLAYRNLAQLTQIADPYLQLDLGYVTGDDTTGTTSRLGSATLSYLVSGNWTAPPTAFGYTYSYDDVGRLTDAAAQAPTGAAFGFSAAGSDDYDLNGNRRQWNRGVTGYSGNYPAIASGGTALAPGVPANGLTAVAPLIANTESFVGASGSSAGAWSWGSNNGGPSTSALVSGAGASLQLKLGGGNALGHYEQLVLDTWLDPAADLTLQVSTSSDSGYSGSGIRAAWTLTLYGPSGPVAAKTLAYLPGSADPGTTTSQQIAVDVAAAVAGSGYAGEITRAQLSLLNLTQSSIGDSAGPAIYVQSLALAWPSPPSWAYGYNDTGSVTSTQQMALSAITHDYLSRQATGLATPTATQAWLRDGAGRSVLTTQTATADSSVATVQNHYDLGGRLIARSRTADGATSISYFVNGPDGMIAAQQDGDLLFTLADQLGSIRALIDGESNAALGSFDYQPFGGLARSSGGSPALARFTNHELDPAGNLIPTKARLLEPSIGRFLQVDPQYDGLSPYAYCRNDPVNLVDPDGEFYQPLIGLAAVEGGFNLYSNYNETNSWKQNLGYFGAGFGTSLMGHGVSIVYSGAFSLAAGTHFLLAGVVQSATTGGLNGLSHEWLTRQISGNWTGYDDSWSAHAERFGAGALSNGLSALGAGIAGTVIGSLWLVGPLGGGAQFYDVRNLGRAFYNPGRDYKPYRNRVNPFIKLYLYYTPPPPGANVWYDLEHTWPQRWTDPAARRWMRTLTNAPVMLIPVAPWFNQLFLEGKGLMWSPFSWALGQKRLANGIRYVYAPLVTVSMIAGTGAGIYSGFRDAASGFRDAAAWLNGPPNGTAPMPEPDREL